MTHQYANWIGGKTLHHSTNKSPKPNHHSRSDNSNFIENSQVNDSTLTTRARKMHNFRPGRHYRKKEFGVQEHMSKEYGDSVHQKKVNSVRFFFQNVKGLTYSSSGEDYEYYLHNIQQLQVDIAGLAETNTPWQHHYIKSEFISRVKKMYPLSKTVFGSPNTEIDPIPESESFQAGGNALIVQGQWTTATQRSIIQDPTGLGRWSGVSVTGKRDRAISILVGYRTCKGSITSSGLGTTFHREYSYYADKNEKSPNPRKFFLQDLELTIQNLKAQGNAVIIMMDANETLSENTDLRKWCDRLDLFDLHRQCPAPSTYIGSANRRIDFMFGCYQILEYVQAAGTLSYLDGPQSDHRSMFVDIDIAEYLHYDANKTTIKPAVSRTLRSGNPEIVAGYHQHMIKYYEDHNMEQRIQELYRNYATLPSGETRRLLEAWDRDQGRAMRHAESEVAKPRRPYAWSPELRNAGILKRYWRLRLKESSCPNADYHDTIMRLQDAVQQHDPKFLLPHLHQALSIPEIRQHLNAATRQLHQTQKASIDNRFRAYQDLLAVYQSDQDADTQKESQRKAKIVKRTIRHEKIRQMFRNIRVTVKGELPNQQSGIHQLKVPVIPTEDSGQGNSNEFQDYIARSNPNDIVWDTVLDQESIERHLLSYNRKSFRAAAQSPCGHGVIYDALTFTSLSESGRKFLDGHIPEEWHGDDITLREFLLSFMIPEHIKSRPPIKTTMSADDISRGISKWKETTSTSPSGRHLGHYKAIIQEPRLLTCLTQFLHVAIKSGISIERWSHATNVMLEKDPGNPCIHRLRIIHLFEADFNLYMKLQWGKRLVRRASKHMLLNTGQFGSVPGRTTLEPIMLTQLTNDNCRILRRSLARFDNDASACFDRIIIPLAMLAARRCGMSEDAIRIHAETLEKMKYSVKTQFGTSLESYEGTKTEPLFGTGQGSGASPAAWLSLVVLIMNTMDRIVSERVRFESPDSVMKHTRLIDAFVDDTSLSFTDAGTTSFEGLSQRLKHIASVWNDLLHYSGGSLNLQKCVYHITTWKWLNGRPTLYQPSVEQADSAVTIKAMQSQQSQPIRYQPYSQPHRILGVYLSPSGDFTSQIRLLKQKADSFASRLQSPRLKARDIVTFLRTTYGPAMGYVLPCLATNEEALHQVQSNLLAVVLQRLGLSSKTPTPLRHGPRDMGGLALPDLRTEMGISQLKLMRNAIWSGTEVGKMLILSLKYSQIEAGIKEPLLEKPGIPVNYLTST